MTEQRWRAADILRLGIGEGQQLVYTRATRTARVLPRPQAALLASCQTFRSIDERARGAASQLEPGGIAATRAQLETLARNGLLVQEASLRARCLAAPRHDAEPKTISAVSVVTADRVASLERCQSSYVDNARSHQRSFKFMVMDDARTAAGFGGLITHRGHVYSATNQSERRTAADQKNEAVTKTAEVLPQAGIEVREVSIGSTPTAGLALDGITEMWPSTYIYGDANQVALGSQRLEDCALALVATVVATPAADRAVADAGSKALSADIHAPGLDGYGIVLGHSDLTVARLSEEHCVLSGRERTGLSIGDRLVIIPTHAFTVVNLHPKLRLISESRHWLPVDARGWQWPPGSKGSDGPAVL